MNAKTDSLYRSGSPATILVVSVLLSFCGCRKPPTPAQIIGSWKSTDGVYALDFRRDGTFAFTSSEAKVSALSDVLSNVGFSLGHSRKVKQDSLSRDFTKSCFDGTTLAYLRFRQARASRPNRPAANRARVAGSGTAVTPAAGRAAASGGRLRCEYHKS